MMLVVLLSSLLAPGGPQPLECPAAVANAINISAHWRAHDGREFSVRGNLLSDTCWLGPRALHLEDRHGARCLSTTDLEGLAQAIAAADFFALPSRLDFPPYYGDEAYALVEVARLSEQAEVLATGFERADTLEGVRFRNLWHYLVALADSSGSSCGVAPNPSLQRTPPG